jgi:hypothetical protein
MKYVLLALIFASNALACPNHLRLQAQQPAPCNGHFFNDKSEFKLRQDYNFMEGRIQNLEKSLELKDLAIERKVRESKEWKNESFKQAKVAADREGDFQKGVWMGVGGSILVFLLMGLANR